jgi:glycine/D-amino acid oxidase-like deaminating enzyme/nitrite reductase/ring-hydroxylating ferredoxin subunit
MTLELDTTPYWKAAAPRSFPRLDADLHVDVAIVGGGITGLTAAYLLASAGRTVAVLERRRCAAVDTGHTTAHLTMVTDLRVSELVKTFGVPHAQATWDAGLAALAHIDAVARHEGIACDFQWVPGYLHAPRGSRDADDAAALKKEAELALDLGFDAEFLEAVPFARVPGVRFDNQARFHPGKYIGGLTRAITERGGRIFEESEAGEFSADPTCITVNGHRVTCQHIVIATHTPLVGLSSVASASLLQTKLALYSTYVVAGRVPRQAVPDALFWDTADPYTYLRLEPQDDGDLVIFGGEDHKTGQADDTAERFDRLERALRTLVPQVEVTHRWSGQVVETADGLPYIGETADRQFAATGFSGNGMTFGALGGMMAADYVLGRQNPWSRLFDPGRKKLLSAAWDYLRENKDYPYYMIRDRFAGPEARPLRTVKRGTGQVIEYGGEQVAAYRDDSGAITMRSAICTHMGCLVDWNEAERTWDCPCHGSRFDPRGGVLAGPAESPLPEVPKTSG